MSSTTTPPREIIWGRRCAIAASTTRRITGLKPDNKRYYDDFTGCGSSVNLTHPRVLQMVMDSLRLLVEVCHVDGFRFDLATTLARGPNGFERNAASSPRSGRTRCWQA